MTTTTRLPRTAAGPGRAPATDRHGAVGTRTLLTCAAVAGPLWVAVSIAQVLTREGFEPTKHPLSQLATGSLGWLQITNFVIAGILATAGAAGLRRVMRGTAGGVAVPRLVRVIGIGMVAAGLLTMDPADGFPVGTPEGVPETMSWHGYGHMIAGSVTFTSMIAAGYLLGRHFSRLGNRRLAVAARVAATVKLTGDAWAMGGGQAGPVTIATGTTVMFALLAYVALHYRRTA
ncbi:DUF998 domain-containing protein [Streptomyces qinzhouensis]|uniref:DUF998 domain-containing protein n=1 Tax=Streptomyces qinzhouensis TaxID=2599401 RepID=A0A5B8IGJ2_9ACTN|nr:DUF998 domain-containing protein [Streptomyces qinzhouensis]QDY77648.1 DUF998 domain-containing protein [Streptomyces qinzhouensis]